VLVKNNFENNGVPAEEQSPLKLSMINMDENSANTKVLQTATSVNKSVFDFANALKPSDLNSSKSSSSRSHSHSDLKYLQPSYTPENGSRNSSRRGSFTTK
jgi:hypothetical protein